MKTTRYFIFTLLMLGTLACVSSSFAEEFVVRQIYFYPSDRVPPEDIDTTLDKVVEDVQKFYADEMERHGFGRKTFRLETDAAGNQVRHHIRGKHTNADYWINDTNHPLDEIIDSNIWDQTFMIHLVYYDRNITTHNSSDIGGIARSGSSYGGSGDAYIYLNNFDNGNYNDVTTHDYRLLFETVAHELGHTFGLNHDFRYLSPYLISAPNTQKQVLC